MRSVSENFLPLIESSLRPDIQVPLGGLGLLRSHRPSDQFLARVYPTPDFIPDTINRKMPPRKYKVGACSVY
jgi:hypothetical protein